MRGFRGEPSSDTTVKTGPAAVDTFLEEMCCRARPRGVAGVRWRDGIAGPEAGRPGGSMVLVSYSGREINAKLVYYGPGLSGKTTNLEFIYSSIPQGQRGKMVSMKTKTERTLFFDFLPVHLGELSGFKTRFLLYTVPGQVYYNATRKLVLKGVDAVVFVADSKRGKMDENVESLENLKENLKDLGLTLDRLPWVIQYNKRDLSDVYTLDELEAVLNPGRAPSFEGVASTGEGVVETFKGISRLLLRKLAKDVGVPVVGSTVEAEAGSSAPAAASANSYVQVIPAAPQTPADRAATPPIPAVQEVPVTVFAADPCEPGWAPPVPVVPAIPAAGFATDSFWTPEADLGPRANRLEEERFGTSEDRSSPLSREPAAADPGGQFPPVAEPVRIRQAGPADASVRSSRSDDDQPSEHHVSVGERLRRWLSRSPEPVDVAEERGAEMPEVAGSLPTPAYPAEIAPTPAPSRQPEPEPFQPAGEFVATVGPAMEAAAEPGVMPAVEPMVEEGTEPAAEPVAEPIVESSAAPAPEPIAALDVSETPDRLVAAEPSAIFQIPIPEVTSLEMAAAQAGMPTIGTPLSRAAFPAPALVSSAPPQAPATQPAVRRRRPREIIVPLELSSDDLSEGVVLKVAIRMQRVASESEEEADQYLA